MISLTSVAPKFSRTEILLPIYTKNGNEKLQTKESITIFRNSASECRYECVRKGDKERMNERTSKIQFTLAKGIEEVRAFPNEVRR